MKAWDAFADGSVFQHVQFARWSCGNVMEAVTTCRDMSLGIIGYPKMMDLTIHEDVKVRTKLWIP